MIRYAKKRSDSMQRWNLHQCGDNATVNKDGLANAEGGVNWRGSG